MGHHGMIQHRSLDQGLAKFGQAEAQQSRRGKCHRPARPVQHRERRRHRGQNERQQSKRLRRFDCQSEITARARAQRHRQPKWPAVALAGEFIVPNQSGPGRKASVPRGAALQIGMSLLDRRSAIIPVYADQGGHMSIGTVAMMIAALTVPGVVDKGPDFQPYKAPLPAFSGGTGGDHVDALGIEVWSQARRRGPSRS